MEGLIRAVIVDCVFLLVLDKVMKQLRFCELETFRILRLCKDLEQLL